MTSSPPFARDGKYEPRESISGRARASKRVVVAANQKAPEAARKETAEAMSELPRDCGGAAREAAVGKSMHAPADPFLVDAQGAARFCRELLRRKWRGVDLLPAVYWSARCAAHWAHRSVAWQERSREVKQIFSSPIC